MKYKNLIYLRSIRFDSSYKFCAIFSSLFSPPISFGLRSAISSRRLGVRCARLAVAVMYLAPPIPIRSMFTGGSEMGLFSAVDVRQLYKCIRRQRPLSSSLLRQK